MDLEIRRSKAPSEVTWKKAHAIPPEARMKKVKNVATNPLTKEKTGRVHLGEQNLASLQENVKKQKALKRKMPEKEIDSEDEREFDEDVQMEEL